MEQDKTNIHVIILAAGQGTRMRSALPKVMHPVGQWPMIGHVLDTALKLEPQDITVVLNPQMVEVQSWIEQTYPAVNFVIQSQQKGTGHAVQCVFDAAHDNPQAQTTLVLYGDTPCMPLEILEDMISVCAQDAYHGVVVGMTPHDPKRYGRIVVTSDGGVERIVEYADATDQEREIMLCNSGMMGFRTETLHKLLSQVQPSQTSQEIYLVDVVHLAKEAGLAVGLIQGPAEALEGVNTRAELAACEIYFQDQCRQNFLLNGVTMLDPATVYFAYDTEIAEDVILEPQIFFGMGVRIGRGSQIRACSYLEGTQVGDNAVVGPFARLRPGTVIAEKARVGNFVELKNTRLGKGSKVNHLSYVGDADVGEDVNIGAGTITCNYDGLAKHATTIGDRVFVGSNTALVAPVTIQEGAVIGAGSVITQTVSAQALAVSRTPQKEIPDRGYDYRHRHKEHQSTNEVA